MDRRPLLRLLAIALVATLAAAGCATDDGTEAEQTPATDGDAEVSLSLGDVDDTVEGNVVMLPVEVSGIEIVAPDGDTSGTTGHFHVFVDADPVAEGETITRGPGIVHSTANPIPIYGLSEGEHTFTVVLGDGAHTRIHGDAEASATVTVDGPTVDATAPATVGADESVVLEVEVSGVEIVAADGDTSGETGHLHVLIDPDQPPAAGMTIPPAQEGSIVHTTETSIDLGTLPPGEHTLYVVVGNGNHVALDPLVADRVSVTVQ